MLLSLLSSTYTIDLQLLAHDDNSNSPLSEMTSSILFRQYITQS